MEPLWVHRKRKLQWIFKHRRYTVYFKSLSQGTEKMSTDFSIFSVRFQIDGNKTNFFLNWSFWWVLIRGVARVRSWGARDPPLVGLLLSKQPTIFRWRKRHDNILAVKAIVEKPTFLKFVFLSLVNMGLHAAIIRLSPLIHEGEQRYKPYIVGDPRMVIWWVASVSPPLKNPGYAPAH